MQACYEVLPLPVSEVVKGNFYFMYCKCSSVFVFVHWESIPPPGLTVRNHKLAEEVQKELHTYF